MKRVHIQRTLVIVTTAIASHAAVALAGEEMPPMEAPPMETEVSSGSVFDDVWALATFYENEDNPFLQKLAFTGRLQADAAFFDANQGEYERLVWRRARMGLKSTVLNDFTIHAEANLNFNRFDSDDIYVGLTDAYVGWAPEDYLQFKIGKQSAGFTLDGSTSSKKLQTLERSPLATNLWFPSEYFTGISVGGDINEWTYKVGGFSSEFDQEFGSFDAGYFLLASLDYDLGETMGFESSSIGIDYVYNDPDYDGARVGTRDLDHIVSLQSKLQNDQWGILSNIAFGSGIEGQSDLFGLQIMPFYNITDNVQAVFNYTFVTSDGDNGVRLNRYESRIERGRSDELHEFFAGINWFIYGHKLKWQNGIEYTTTSDSANDGGAYDGWGFTSGIRLSW